MLRELRAAISFVDEVKVMMDSILIINQTAKEFGRTGTSMNSLQNCYIKAQL